MPVRLYGIINQSFADMLINYLNLNKRKKQLFGGVRWP